MSRSRVESCPNLARVTSGWRQTRRATPSRWSQSASLPGLSWYGTSFGAIFCCTGAYFTTAIVGTANPA